MENWNYVCICIGICNFLGSYLQFKYNKARYDRYIEKLHIKYGNIDDKKVIRFEKICKYGLGIFYILLGLLLRKASIAIMLMFAIVIVILILDYPIKKKYIIINDNEQKRES